MSWIWEKSPLWRKIVRGTRTNRVAMGAFSLTTMFALPVAAGVAVMRWTTPDVSDDDTVALRKRVSMDARRLQANNNDDLNDMLDEVRRGVKNEERWRAALDGRTTSARTSSGTSLRR